MKHLTTLPRAQSRLTRSLLAIGLACGLGLANGHALEQFPMPADVKFDSNPNDRNSPTNKVLTMGVDADGTTIPTKTVKIINNTAQMVFPIMRDPNSNVLASNPAVGLYDPYDPVNKEYRGYIGYKGNDGKYYFGLKPGQSVLVTIPLVFWNGARIGLGTDGKYLLAPKDPNPMRYDPASVKTITDSVTSTDIADSLKANTISNGVVMWYRAEISRAPNDDTEDQLAEWTIRDHGYLSNPKITAKTNNEIPDNQLVTLINYDVSNVDNLYLPVAMEAVDVWVVPQGAGSGPHANRDGWKAGSDPAPYGWTGAVNSIDFLQKEIRAFTKDKNKLLGQYFGGKGWPHYNMPNPDNDPKQPIKIPSGANIFAQSPIKSVPSSYGGNDWKDSRYMLSSGGEEAVKVSIGNSTTINQKGSTVLNLNALESDKTKIDFIKVGYAVTGVPDLSKPQPAQPIAPGTTVKAVDYKNWTVTLSKPLLTSSELCTYDFVRPTRDYAADAMIRLWYSWAQYYLTNWKSRNAAAPTAPTQIKGTIEPRTATLRLDKAHPELVEGMAVDGPGLSDAMTENGIHQGKAVILQISEDKKSVVLSQVATPTATKNATYTVMPPQPLLWTPKKKGDPGYPLIDTKFTFPANEAEKERDPYEFAQKVYLIMASMNQIGEPNNDSICKFMQDIIGANMGFIFDQPGKDAEEGQMVIAMIRDMIKSVLRGVTDFTKYPDVVDAKGNHLSWYPDPSLKRGGQDFNVFNLDPFVWFVHVKLGFSGYGFSVDDDTADVGAGGANHMQLTVTGTKGLDNPNAWSIQAPFGPINGVSCTYSGPDEGDTLYSSLANVSNTTPMTITTVGPHNIRNGETVVIDQVVGNTAANGTFTARNVSRNTFDLYKENTMKPVAPKGTYTPTPTPGRWSYPKRPYIDTGDLKKVFWRVTGDDAMGTFEGTVVTVDGIPTDKSHKIRVWQRGLQYDRDVAKGRLILNGPIKNADGTNLPAGTYKFSFSGDVPEQKE